MFSVCRVQNLKKNLKIIFFPGAPVMRNLRVKKSKFMNFFRWCWESLVALKRIKNLSIKRINQQYHPNTRFCIKNKNFWEFSLPKSKCRWEFCRQCFRREVSLYYWMILSSILCHYYRIKIRTSNLIHLYRCH